MKKVIKILASLKLAVVVMIGIALLTAIGTIVEAKYDAYAAKKIIYSSWMMYSVMIVFAINLTAVILDRWPWKPKHSAFIFAHIGILMILMGSLLTLKYGIDGTMTIPIGQSNRYVTLPDTDFIIYSSFDGERYTKLFESPVDFFNSPPNNQKPFVAPLDNKKIEIIDYKKYVIPKKQITPISEDKAGSALRFQIKNDNVDVVEWVVQRKAQESAVHNFGPAKLFLGEAPIHGQNLNEIYVTPLSNEVLKVTIFKKDEIKPFKVVMAKEGDHIETGWMGLKLSLLRFHPKAKEEWDVVERDYPTPLTTSAVRIRYEGKEMWALLNDVTKFFSDSAVFLVTYANRRQDIGFEVKLHHFEITNYPGSMKAMAYKSIVQIYDDSDVNQTSNAEPSKKEIYMNHPLSHDGLLLYQASFQQEDPMSAPTASVLSVNYDPGRFLKYLGSIVMTLGVILLFYFRKLYFKKGNS